ncbi:MAG: ester cyclase [Chloroflexi bacterium]|nr:ester cyclase [Chloroflexota bacterium]
MEDDNRQLVERLFETINSQKGVNALDEFFSGSYQSHNDEIPPGLAGIRQFYAMLRTGFPDGSLTLEDVSMEGDRVNVRSTLRGTHEGDVWGFPQTGKSVELPIADTWRVADGRLVEHWGGVNRDELAQQLGERPTPVPEGGEPPSRTE